MKIVFDLNDNTEALYNNEGEIFKKASFGTTFFDLLSIDINKYIEILQKYNVEVSIESKYENYLNYNFRYYVNHDFRYYVKSNIDIDYFHNTYISNDAYHKMNNEFKSINPELYKLVLYLKGYFNKIPYEIQHLYDEDYFTYIEEDSWFESSYTLENVFEANYSANIFISKYIKDSFYHNIHFIEYMQDMQHMEYLFFFDKKDGYKDFGDEYDEYLTEIYYKKVRREDKITHNQTDECNLDIIKNEYLEHYVENQDNIYNHIVRSIQHLSDTTIYYIVKNDFPIKTCENCSKYFIPFYRSDTIYCDRISPQDNKKTCKEYGSQQAWKKTLANNEALGLCRKLYMQKQMLAKRNPDIKTHINDFENFKVQSKQWKKEAKEGTKTYEEFLKWLESVKGKSGE